MLCIRTVYISVFTLKKKGIQGNKLVFVAPTIFF